MSTKTVILLLLIVNIASQTFVSAELKTESFKTDFLKSGHFIKDVDSLTNPGLVYGSCHEQNINGTVFTANCSFAMENKKYAHSENHVNFCNFALETEVISKETTYQFQSVAGIDKNKAVLTLQTDGYTKLFVLHFATCQAVPVKVDFQTESVKVQAPFDDVFDIYITGEDYLCQDRRLVCKLTVDTRGNVVSEVENWSGIFTELLAVTRSPSKGRIVVDVHRSVFKKTFARVYTIEDNREVEILQEYSVDEPDFETGNKVAATSTTYKFVSLCSTLSGNITCAQFDLDGRMKLERRYSIPVGYEVQEFNVHNLKNGGLLLLTQESAQENPDEGRSYARKFNAAGDSIGKVEIDSFGKIDVEDLHFFVNEDTKMCLSHALPHSQGRVADLRIACFTDEDLLPEEEETVDES